MIIEIRDNHHSLLTSFEVPDHSFENDTTLLCVDAVRSDGKKARAFLSGMTTKRGCRFEVTAKKGNGSYPGESRADATATFKEILRFLMQLGKHNLHFGRFFR